MKMRCVRVFLLLLLLIVVVVVVVVVNFRKVCSCVARRSIVPHRSKKITYFIFVLLIFVKCAHLQASE